MNYTKQFRQYQRLQVSVLNTTPAAAYHPIQTLESQQLIHNLLENTGSAESDFQGHIQRTVASIIHTLLYSFYIKDYNNPGLCVVVKFNEEFL
jgi:hypothetical protein